MIAAARTVRLVSVAALAARISASPLAPCSHLTSCRFVCISRRSIFCNEVKGKSALPISRDLGVSYKACFVLLHKIREAMAGELKDRMINGEGKVAEVNGGYFGGYVKPANLKENRRDRRLIKTQSGKRQCVVIVRERGGDSVPAVFKSESSAANFIKARVAKGTTLNADEAGSWDSLIWPLPSWKALIPRDLVNGSFAAPVD